MKLVLRLLGLAGVIVFGFALALTFLSPIHVERAARSFIQSQIERQITNELGIVRDRARETRVGRLAKAVAERHDEEFKALREGLATGINAQIVAVVVRMQDLNCECRERMQRGLDAATELRLAELERAKPQLHRLIEGRYSEVVADLLRDVRIFTGTNLVAFLLLLGLSILKPTRVRQLFVPGVLLGVAAVTASSVYLFGQNWFFTLLYEDYVGLTYGIWLLLIFGLFCDVALFKARITTRVVDAVFSALGKAAVPC